MPNNHVLCEIHIHETPGYKFVLEGLQIIAIVLLVAESIVFAEFPISLN